MRMEGAEGDSSPGMGNRLFIRIAEVVVCIVPNGERPPKLTLAGAERHFTVGETLPDVVIEARWDDNSGTDQRGKKFFYSGPLWHLLKEQDAYLFSFHSPSFGAVPYKVARLRQDFARGEVALHFPYFKPDQPIYPLEYPLDELALINFLSMGKGVEIHSLGIVDSLGKGHLFVGQSGTGKSTMARLWREAPGFKILSDDRIILRKMGQRFWMYGTPWHGDAHLASPDRAPLTGIYFLRKGRKNELMPLSQSDALGAFLACSFLPFYNRRALEFSLDFLKEVVTQYPCYEIKFFPDKRVVEFIQKKTEE